MLFMRNDSMKQEEKNIPSYILDNIEKEKQIGLMINEIKKDLKTNSVYKKFFDQYNQNSVDTFIDQYAFKKTSYLTYGELYKANEEKNILRYQLEAEERLWEIQRKKLFNLECQWRAELIKIPEIEISLDFEYWEKNIENCPFVGPITDEDFELYTDYLLGDNFYDFDLSYSWQTYNDIKKSAADDGEIPPWYEFYDSRKGTTSFMLLPDTRGGKEAYYISVWQKNHSVKAKAAQKENGRQKKDKRPILFSNDIAVLEEFIKRFESKKLLEYFRLYEKEVNKSNDEIDQALEILKNADEDVPIESSYNWREAIIMAARRYEQRKLAEALKQVYRQYLYRLKVGISQETHGSHGNIQWMKDWASEVKEQIIEARKLLGEAPDLNF